MFCQRCSEASGANEDCGEIPVGAENMADILREGLGIISVSLLPETAEIIQILPNLRIGRAQFSADFFGGYPADSVCRCFFEMTQRGSLRMTGTETFFSSFIVILLCWFSGFVYFFPAV